MQVKSAIGYPFRKGNFVRTVVIPSLLSIAALLVFVIPLAVTLPKLLAMSSALSEPGALNGPPSPVDISQQALVSFLCAMGAGIVFAMLATLPVYGYYWELIHRLQTEGLASSAPSWKGHWKKYYQWGFQAFLAGIVLFIPLAIATLPLGLLVPFVIAPYFLAAQEKTVGSVLRSIGPGIAWTLKRFGAVLMGFYLGIVLSILYSLVSSLFSFTIVGPLFLNAAFSVTYICLMTDQFAVLPASKRSQNKSQEKPKAMVPAPSVGEEANQGPATEALGEAVMVYSTDPNLKAVSGGRMPYMHRGENPWLRPQ